MKLAPECRNCLKDKIRSQAAYVVRDEQRLDEIVAACLETFDEGVSRNEGAAVASGRMHRLCYQMAGSQDLYVDIKERDNTRAVEVVAAVQPMIATLHDALIASVIGNAMDYGVTGHTVAENFTAFFKEIFTHGLAIDDSEKFFPLAKRVVYFTDNCGEVLFDMRFIQKLKEAGSSVTVVVKEGPMLNDVTIKEAEEVGLFQVADAVYFGGGGQQLGTHPQFFPQEVKDALADATLIIAKGLANYESMTEYEFGKPIAYLMMIKCDAVGRHISETSGHTVKKGDLIAYLKK